MISATQNRSLLLVGNAAAPHPEWAAYAAYCFARERGLRKVAFQQVATLLTQAATWTLDERISFVSFLLSFCDTVADADYGLLPHPMSEQLVKPTLLDWFAREPLNARPVRWLGIYYRDPTSLLRALALDPTDDAGREVLLSWWLYSIYHAVHHLPDGYIGEPDDTLALGDLVQEHINQLTSSGKQAYWTDELESDLELVRNYVAWKASGYSNLVQWGAEQGKRVSYNGGATYYYEK